MTPSLVTRATCKKRGPASKGWATIFARAAVWDYIPVVVGGCAHWFDADRGITVATGISSAVDQSGSGNTVAQGTGSAQPALTKDLANLQSAGRFVGASSQHLVKANTNIIAAGAWSMYTVMSTTGNNLGIYGNSFTNAGVTLGMNGIFRTVLTHGVAARDDGTPAAVPETWSSTRVAAAAPLFWLNGDPTTISGGASTGQVDPGATASLLVGAYISAGAPAQFLTGDVYAGLMYNVAHAELQRRRVDRYLVGRYGTGP